MFILFAQCVQYVLFVYARSTTQCYFEPLHRESLLLLLPLCRVRYALFATRKLIHFVTKFHAIFVPSFIMQTALIGHGMKYAIEVVIIIAMYALIAFCHPRPCMQTLKK